jgi:ribosomal protein S18 acetylase RimI-like enzyme
MLELEQVYRQWGFREVFLEVRESNLAGLGCIVKWAIGLYRSLKTIMDLLMVCI